MTISKTERYKFSFFGESKYIYIYNKYSYRYFRITAVTIYSNMSLSLSIYIYIYIFIFKFKRYVKVCEHLYINVPHIRKYVKGSSYLARLVTGTLECRANIGGGGVARVIPTGGGGLATRMGQ